MRGYLLSVAAAAMAVSVLSAVLKEGTVKKSLRIAGGLFLSLVLLRPIAAADLDAFGQYLAGFELQADAAESGIRAESREIMAAIIAEKTEAYIWDKAESLGAAVTVSVEVVQGSSWPYPYSCEIRGSMTEQQRNALCRDLAASLAIPEERQVYLP